MSRKKRKEVSVCVVCGSTDYRQLRAGYEFKGAKDRVTPHCIECNASTARVWAPFDEEAHRHLFFHAAGEAL